MGKFINTQRVDTVNSLVDGVKSKLNNPYYPNIEQKPTITTYYNQDIKASTLDEGAKITYSNLGEQSSIKYNKINNMFVYGIDRININLENGDWGLEADTIEGEAIILPNTIIPYPNDYFSINYLEKDILFKILSVSNDTIENGSNLYKIQYKLDQLGDDVIEKQVLNNYEMIINNVGTQFNPIIRSSDYEFIKILENISFNLVRYYKSLFYSKRVQTFVFNYNDAYFYDPFMIEFLIRNKILDNGEDYLYITHQASIPNTFGIDYDKTFFRYVEVNDKHGFTPKINSQADLIEDPLSILSSRIEDYYKINYIYNDNIVKPVINNFDSDLIKRIRAYSKYDILDDKNYLNIIIKYFNNNTIDSEDIKFIEKIDYKSTIELFYIIPIIIYIFNYQIKNVLKSS